MSAVLDRLSREQVEAVRRRVATTQQRRQDVKRNLKAGKLPSEIDSPSLVAARFRRMGGESVLASPGRLERVIGSSNLVPAAVLERGAKVGRAVARVRVLDADGELIGWGSGLMVSPSLFLTNHHVLQTADVAAHSRIEFNYQDGLNGKPLPVASFELDPGAFFETDGELDFTIVAVRASGAALAQLASFGFCRLLSVPAKALLGEYLNIIQHPQGQPKQVALRENRLVARLDNFVHYETDTAPGSSGSPVFNDQWEVVALHHAGVPAQNEQGDYLAVDGGIWTDDMGEQRLQWVANEGVRVSSIYAHLKALDASGTRARLLEELLHPPEAGLPGATLHEAPPRRGTTATATAAASSGDGAAREQAPQVLGTTATWTLPIRLSVDVGGTTTGAAPSVAAVVEPSAPAPAGADLGARLDTDVRADGTDVELELALVEVRAARDRTYYAEADDLRDRERYYAQIDLAARDVYPALRDLLQSTHTTRLRYKPALQVYPWLDLQPNLKLKSVYSSKEYDPEQLIRDDMRIDAERAARIRELYRKESAVTSEALDVLEAAFPYNCEHVVPQSWFKKREPMRGDLHHLFACESGCNSFRGNTPYFDFADFEEVIRSSCGKREGNCFEPGDGKGVVARAVLYFLLRYPGEVNATDAEYDQSRIETLLEWHRSHEVSQYERHRNSVAFEKQGNRNPLIDFPELAGRIDFRQGLG